MWHVYAGLLSLLQEKILEFDAKYIRPLLERYPNSVNHHILNTFTRLQYKWENAFVTCVTLECNLLHENDLFLSTTYVCSLECAQYLFVCLWPFSSERKQLTQNWNANIHELFAFLCRSSSEKKCLNGVVSMKMAATFTVTETLLIAFIYLTNLSCGHVAQRSTWIR